MSEPELKVGGWVGIVKSDIARPHVPVERFPPSIDLVSGWVPVAMRDPLGLTAENVSRWPDPDPAEAVRKAAAMLLDRIRDNLAAIDALPAGTMIRCGYHWCEELHPIEMFR